MNVIVYGHLAAPGEPSRQFALAALLWRSDARAFRLLLMPSFSRNNIVLRVDMNRSGGGVLHAAWFVDDNPIPPNPGQYADLKAGAEAYNSWRGEVLLVRTVERSLLPAEAEAIWTLQRKAMPPSVLSPELDVNLIVAESVDRGRRSVGVSVLDSPPAPSGELFCALVQKSGVPDRILENSDVEGVCPQAKDAGIRERRLP